jgi:hypothetical protein
MRAATSLGVIEANAEAEEPASMTDETLAPAGFAKGRPFPAGCGFEP